MYAEGKSAQLRQAEKRGKSAARDAELSVLRGGRGPEFVLEFTAVVVIVFAATALGILRILDTQQLGTLLAAIAGYVLGRATSRGGATASERRTESAETSFARTGAPTDVSSENRIGKAPAEAVDQERAQPSNAIP